MFTRDETDAAVATRREPELTCCVVCGTALAGETRPINDGWGMTVCRACDAGITTPLPSPEDLAEFNAGFYEPSVRAAMYRSRRSEFKDRWDDLMAFGSPEEPIGSLLDVGCSLGFLVAHARDRGIPRTAGVEINAKCRDWGRSRLGIDVRASWQEFGEERFELIVMMDVVEHVLDPIGLLSSATALLRPEGRLIIQAPNRRSDMARRAGPRWSWYSAPDHVMHMTPATLPVLAERAGLELHAVRTGDVPADYLIDVLPWVPARAFALLRHLPRIRSLRVRDDGRGGLLQAVLGQAAAIR